MKKGFLLYVLVLIIFFITGCSHTAKVSFPPADELYVTSNEGKADYTPIGKLLYITEETRIPLPLIGYIPFNKVNPSEEFRTAVTERVREMGGDAVIDLRINWEPSSNGFLGFLANGGRLAIYGTVVNRKE